SPVSPYSQTTATIPLAASLSVSRTTFNRRSLPPPPSRLTTCKPCGKEMKTTIQCFQGSEILMKYQ
ncbi:unnamed protein product, partial [Eruca vesicaria subsp. sativa]|nr:unnamed protein product [Eruca vesicaria subsp. sativa]